MISVVVPIYNEEEIIGLLHGAVDRAMQRIGEAWEVVYVNDGSKDSSLEMLREIQAEDPHVVVVELSRNWGHMGALWAGMRTAQGDAVILMDGDLQDPPDVLIEMVSAWRAGAQVVTAVRRKREESRKLLSVLFPLFYRVLDLISDFPIPLSAGIFGLLDRKAVDSINSLRECNRYLPGLRAWVGYRTATVCYDRRDRVGGEGKLTLISRIKYAMDATVGFSYKPLRLSFVLAAIAFVLAMILGISAILSRNVAGVGVMASVFFVGGFILMALGIMGEYVARVYDEGRSRPVSIINHVYRAEDVYREQSQDLVKAPSKGQREDIGDTMDAA